MSALQIAIFAGLPTTGLALANGLVRYRRRFAATSQRTSSIVEEPTVPSHRIDYERLTEATGVAPDGSAWGYRCHEWVTQHSAGLAPAHAVTEALPAADPRPRRRPTARTLVAAVLLAVLAVLVLAVLTVVAVAYLVEAAIR